MEVKDEMVVEGVVEVVVEGVVEVVLEGVDQGVSEGVDQVVLEEQLNCLTFHLKYIQFMSKRILELH